MSLVTFPDEWEDEYEEWDEWDFDFDDEWEDG